MLYLVYSTSSTWYVTPEVFLITGMVENMLVEASSPY